MKLLDNEVPPLGMGCWPIGGPMYAGEKNMGYSRTDDTQSLRTLHAAYDGGIRVFDSAAAYGAGHADRLLGKAFKGRDDVVIVTKIGIAIDEATRQLIGEDNDPANVMPAIDSSLKRLQSDCIDIVLLHPNSMPVETALPIFDELEKARQTGKIGGYGWSTDFTANVESLDGREGVVAIEHAMNVFFDAPRIQPAIETRGLAALIRSPLAMGLLGGKYDAASKLPAEDIRSGEHGWMAYYKDGTPNREYLSRIDAIRDLLQTGGRSLPQGALCWLWGKRDANVPIPGARTPEQITDTAGALAFGPLPDDVMGEIETLIKRGDPEPERER